MCAHRVVQPAQVSALLIESRNFSGLTTRWIPHDQEAWWTRSHRCLHPIVATGNDGETEGIPSYLKFCHSFASLHVTPRLKKVLEISVKFAGFIHASDVLDGGGRQERSGQCAKQRAAGRPLELSK